MCKDSFETDQKANFFAKDIFIQFYLKVILKWSKQLLSIANIVCVMHLETQTVNIFIL